MNGLTVFLAYASWAAGPLVAYSALSFGVRRAAPGLAMVFGLYSVEVLLVAIAAWRGSAVTPLSVILPWGGVAVLSGLFYALGAWIGRKQ